MVTVRNSDVATVMSISFRLNPKCETTVRCERYDVCFYNHYSKEIIVGVRVREKEVS